MKLRMHRTQIGRFLFILKTLIAFGIDQLVLNKRCTISWWLCLINPRFKKYIRNTPRGKKIVEMIIDLGPIYVKFGQILSTRSDLIPDDIATALTQLQDRVPPFASEVAIACIEQKLKQPISEIFTDFDATPLASASIAQVHAATLNSGEKVVVKVLRPKVKHAIKKDISLLYTLVFLLEKLNKEATRLRGRELVDEFKETIHTELDLITEAANYSQLRRNFKTSELLYVPKIYWEYTHKNILVVERIHGININKIKLLKKAKTNLKRLAENGVEIFFTQVFRDNFFHADMHPGNIFVDVSNPEYPQYIAVDFGIVGTLTPADQYYLAENFLAFFSQDYNKIAKLHIESGWVPKDTRIDRLERAVRSVCEPIVAKPLSEISFANLLVRLFQVGRQFKMQVQPQLLLLQKTLFNIEALGRDLYPELDLWQTAKPFLEDWGKQKSGLQAFKTACQKEWPSFIEKLPTAPRTIHQALLALDNISKQYESRPNDHTFAVKTYSKSKKYCFAGLICFAFGLLIGFYIS